MAAVRYQRKVFKDIIKDAIYDAIISGELKQGDRVIEMDWAEKFGSSQAPVREAIRDLEARGVIETAPYKGAVVRVIDKDKLNEIHAIRAGLEAVALKKVINENTEEDIKKIRKVFDEMVKAAENGDPNTFLDKDIEFHETIVDLAGMSDLKKMWDMCNIRLWTAFSMKYTRMELIELGKNHEVILRKIEEKDLSDILETILGHFSNVTESLK